MGEVMRRMGARPEECPFWATHGGAELNLLVIRRGQHWGFELQHTALPGTTLSMHTVLTDLRLDRLLGVHSGARSFPLAGRVEALTLAHLGERLPEMQGPWRPTPRAAPEEGPGHGQGAHQSQVAKASVSWIGGKGVPTGLS